MISAISVKDRLKNRAIATGKTMQETLTAYGLERTVYRLSVSEYKERFTLKGGIFLYALFDGEFVRATRDIDLLAKNIPNNLQDMRNIFEKIFAIESDDALKFDPDTLDVKSITEFKEYHGVNVSIIAYLDRTKIPVSIDIGFGDIIYPDRIKMDFPVLLNILECEKLTSCVVEHAVHHHPDIQFMRFLHKFPEIFIVSQPSVHQPVISRIISVRGGFKQGTYIYCRASDLSDMRQPFHQALKPVRHLCLVISPRRPCHTDRIHMIKHCFFKPFAH